ncbi:UNVERIFIED_CONTAM: hypothetical protein K2H54_061454 [Gekko kuhli]
MIGHLRASWAPTEERKYNGKQQNRTNVHFHLGLDHGFAKAGGLLCMQKTTIQSRRKHCHHWTNQMLKAPASLECQPGNLCCLAAEFVNQQFMVLTAGYHKVAPGSFWKPLGHVQGDGRTMRHFSRGAGQGFQHGEKACYVAPPLQW